MGHVETAAFGCRSSADQPWHIYPASRAHSHVLSMESKRAARPVRITPVTRTRLPCWRWTRPP